MAATTASKRKKNQDQQRPPYRDFIKDKQRFFMALSDNNKAPDNALILTNAEKAKRDLSFAINQANQKQANGEAENYQFLVKDKAFIEPEYKHLMSILKKNDSEHSFITNELKTLVIKLENNADDAALLERREQLTKALERNDEQRKQLNEPWLRCLYYACLLLMSARGYGYNEDGQVANYKQDIKYLCLSYQRIEPAGKNTDTWQQILNDLDELASTPEHISKIRGWVGLANAYRLLFVFNRLMWQQSVTLARELQWFNKLETMGLAFNLERLNVFNHLFNILSVALFASRFLMSVLMVLKHTFVPTKAEMGLDASQRFWDELNKRHWGMVNDLVWALINGLSNFAVYLHIAAPVANWLLAGFLVFDVLWMGWRLYQEEQLYFAKKAQYTKESSKLLYVLGACEQKLEDANLTPQECAELEEQLQQLKNQRMVLKEQLQQLEINRCETNWTTLFNFAAALLLMAGFSAVIILSIPAIVPICFLFCTIAVAMYLSADQFGAYMKARLVYQQDKKNNLVSASTDATQAAWNMFVMSMVKTTVMPVLIVGVFAVCWPAALTLTLLYIAYECGRGYFNQPAKPVDALPAPVVDVEKEPLDDGAGWLAAVNY